MRNVSCKENKSEFSTVFALRSHIATNISIIDAMDHYNYKEMKLLAALNILPWIERSRRIALPCLRRLISVEGWPSSL